MAMEIPKFNSDKLTLEEAMSRADEYINYFLGNTSIPILSISWGGKLYDHNRDYKEQLYSSTNRDTIRKLYSAMIEKYNGEIDMVPLREDSDFPDNAGPYIIQVAYDKLME